MDRFSLKGLFLSAMTALCLLAAGCSRLDTEPSSVPEPAVSVTEQTDTTVTTAETTETEVTMQTFAVVTDADPSEYQHRNYSSDPDDPDDPEEEITLPTVQTVTTAKTTRTTARATQSAAQTTRSASAGTTQSASAGTTARSTVTTVKTTKSTTVTTTTAPNLSALKSSLDKTVKAYKRNCAVLLTAADGTVLYSYHPDTAISGASLIKLPYVYFCCNQLSGGVRSLNDTVTYTKSWYHGGSGIIRKNGYNKSYTVAQLIEYALKYSDNVAYDMLVYLFGIDGFNQMVKSWGYSVSISASRFPAVTANFMRTAMEKMKAASNNGKCWRIAWSALTNSEHSYVRDTLGISGMAVKYGSISAQYHETCYVPGEMPYTLVILSGAVNYKPDVSFVQNVARAANKLADGYAISLRPPETITTTTTTTTTTETTASATETESESTPASSVTVPDPASTSAEEHRTEGAGTV